MLLVCPWKNCQCVALRTKLKEFDSWSVKFFTLCLTVIKGKILWKIQSEKYEFSSSTGEMDSSEMVDLVSNNLYNSGKEASICFPSCVVVDEIKYIVDNLCVLIR